MSIYRSEISATNTTEGVLTIGTASIDPSSTLIFWDTQGTRVNSSAFLVFNQFRDNRSTIDPLVENGSILISQDGVTLSYTQYLALFLDLVDSVDRATNLDELLFPVKTSPVQSNGVPLFSQSPRVGNDWVIGSHNFADKCTWFQDSVRVVGETLTNSGDGLTFTSSQSCWIDMTSGRMHNEGFWVYYQQATNPSDPHGYQPKVYVNGTLATMREPFETSGGDYEIIWEEGKVTFFTSQTGNTITADFSYPTTSYFHASTRKEDYNLIVEDAEADMSLDTIMNDEIVYSWWGYDTETSTWVEMGKYSYSRMSQIITEARGAYPVFSSTGSTEEEKALGLAEFRRKSRGTRSNRQAVSFNYSTIRTLPLGVELRIYTKHHRELGGEHVTITLYCTESKVEE